MMGSEKKNAIIIIIDILKDFIIILTHIFLSCKTNTKVMQMKFDFIYLFIVLFLINSYATDYRIFLNKGDEYYNKFELNLAVKNYEEAYKLANHNYEVLTRLTRTYNDLGEDYYELRNRENSEAAINNALKYAESLESKFPDSSMTYALLAMSYGNLAMFKGGNEKIKLAHKIKKNAEKSINLDSHNYLPYIILSIYHRQIASLSWLERAFANTFFGKVPDGSLEESERMMLKALEIQPGICVAMLHLSRTYHQMDNYTKEKEWLQKIIDAPIIDFRDKYAKRKAKNRLDEIES
jgi:tetratricopeptide (TPR) repeat protein